MRDLRRFVCVQTHPSPVLGLVDLLHFLGEIHERRELSLGQVPADMAVQGPDSGQVDVQAWTSAVDVSSHNALAAPGRVGYCAVQYHTRDSRNTTQVPPGICSTSRRSGFVVLAVKL